MINLPVSEAYALDYLAILEVKKEQGLPVDEELTRVGSSIRDQLGVDVMARVLASREYLVLLKANQSVFDTVAASRMSPAQTANRCRYRAKAALQKRFWPKKPLAERKTQAEQ